jgi:arsenate reductase
LTLKRIVEGGIEPDVIEYLKTPPTADELDSLLTKLGLEPQELMRKKESIYKELGLATKDLTRDEAIQIMVDNPVLIERPIVVKGNKAIIGRPPENVDELL